jgi:hypothetical protein
MATPVWRTSEEHIEAIVERAAAAGFELLQHETPHGQLVWEWRCGDEPRPQFVSRRVAFNFMDDWLRRNAATRRRLHTLRRARR